MNERELLQRVASDRHELHRDHGSSRPLSEGYEECGLAGEWAFAQAFHQRIDAERKPQGDGGIDFYLPLMFSLDVKTARKAFNLAVERGKVTADIYVLAQFDGNILNARLLGWEWGAIVAQAPLRDLGYGIINHCIPTAKLRPMSELKQRLVILGVVA